MKRKKDCTSCQHCTKLNGAQQPRYFVRYSYLHRLQKTKYDFIPQELFETWLKHMETNYLEFDLLFVTKM